LRIIAGKERKRGHEQKEVAHGRKATPTFATVTESSAAAARCSKPDRPRVGGRGNPRASPATGSHPPTRSREIFSRFTSKLEPALVKDRARVAVNVHGPDRARRDRVFGAVTRVEAFDSCGAVRTPIRVGLRKRLVHQ
jgi:hypothetical protein